MLDLILDYWIFFLLGIFFLFMGYGIPKYHWNKLIAGVNGASDKNRDKMNLDYIEKTFGRFMLLLGICLVLDPIVLTVLDKQSLIYSSFPWIIVGVGVLMFLFGMVNKNKMYNDQ